MIRNEIVEVILGGKFIYPTDVSITMGVGRAYIDVTLSMLNNTTKVGDELVIRVNENEFKVKVSSIDNSKNNNATLICLGLPSKLEKTQPSDEEFEYSSSIELIEDSSKDIEVVSDLPVVEFVNQTYSGNTTPLSRILSMVELVKGEYWEQDSKLHLSKMKRISATAQPTHVFSDAEVFEYAYSENDTIELQTKDVIINPISDDIYSETSITLDFDNQINRGEVFFNPSLSKGYDYSSSGLDVMGEQVLQVQEEVSLIDGSHIELKGGVDRVISITLNGEPLSDYVLYPSHNVIRFEQRLTGEVSVTYQTLGLVVFCYITSSFNIRYFCSEIKDTIEIDPSAKINSKKCFVEMLPPITYERGGEVLLSVGSDYTLLFVEEKGAMNLETQDLVELAGGGTLTVKNLYTTTQWSNLQFMYNITSEVITEIEVMSKEVIEVDGVYLVYLDKHITSINDIYFGSQKLIGYEYIDDEFKPHITFQPKELRRKVDMSVNVTYTKVTIPQIGVNTPVTLIDVIGCAGVATLEVTLDDDALCRLPATFYIDIAKMFNLSITKIFGKTVGGDFGTLKIDNLGRVQVTVTQDKEYKINTTLLVKHSSITIDARNVPYGDL